MVVLADADLDEAAAAANFGAFMNSGQICMSTERIVVDRAVADELAAKLAERAGSADASATRATRARWSARSSTTARRERVLELLEDARAKGAEVLTGGEADGNVIAPDGRRPA